jgi:U3 small nucleolar RNA-associated protein 20
MPVKVYATMTHKILPVLIGALTARKLHTSDGAPPTPYEIEDAQLYRVPIALAACKLLLRLPPASIEEHLPGVVLRVCHLLRSRSAPVRKTTRDTLVAMSIALGWRYVPYIVRQLRQLFTRGYQVHVCAYTVHTMLAALRPSLCAGQLDACVVDVLAICVDEMFGALGDEKEVAAIRANVFEARQANKSLHTLDILARFVSHIQLDVIVRTFEHALAEQPVQRSRVVTRAGEALRHVAIALGDNECLPTVHVMAHVNEWLSNNTPKMMGDDIKSSSAPAAGTTKLLEQHSDCLLIPVS